MGKKTFSGKVFILILLITIYSPSSIGRGGGGGGGGGKKGYDCPIAFKSVYVRPVFDQTTINSMPPGYDVCGVPDRESNYIAYGGNDESTINDFANKYTCMVIVTRLDRRCKDGYKEVYYWTEPGAEMEIKVPYQYKYSVDVFFYEKCSKCLIIPNQIYSAKVYSSFNEYVFGAPSVIHAQMKYKSMNFNCFKS